LNSHMEYQQLRISHTLEVKTIQDVFCQRTFTYS